MTSIEVHCSVDRADRRQQHVDLSLDLCKRSALSVSESSKFSALMDADGNSCFKDRIREVFYSFVARPTK